MLNSLLSSTGHILLCIGAMPCCVMRKPVGLSGRRGGGWRALVHPRKPRAGAAAAGCGAGLGWVAYGALTAALPSPAAVGQRRAPAAQAGRGFPRAQRALRKQLENSICGADVHITYIPRALQSYLHVRPGMINI